MQLTYIFLFIIMLVSAGYCNTQDILFLIHGLHGAKKDMEKIGSEFSEQYQIVNFSYPSTNFPIEILVNSYLKPEISKYLNARNIHFITHSMGGILLRLYLKDYTINNLGKIIMISPPNQGSEVADFFYKTFFYKLRYGPAGSEVTTAGINALSLPTNLKTDVGIIAGSGTQLPFFSWFIKGKDDGKISAEKTKLDNMSDFIVLPYSHDTIIFKNKTIIRIRNFLLNSSFSN